MLKERNKDEVIELADPDGAALYNYYAHGELKARATRSPRASVRADHPNLEGAPVDVWFHIMDEEACR